MGLGIGISPALMKGVGASLPALSAGARILFAGHSKPSQVSVAGMKNFPLHTMERLAGLGRLAIGGDQGIGGDTTSQYIARIAYTTGQAADIVVVQIAHNSLGSGAAAVNADLDTIKSTLEAANPTKRLVFLTETPSNLWPLNDATLIAVNAHIMGFHGTNGGRTTACDVSTGFDYATMCYLESNLTDRIHENEVGAAYVAGLLATHLSAMFTATSIETILDEISATGDHGADSCPAATHNMTGTGGATAGAGFANISGTIPASFTVTNNSASLSIACSVDAQSGYNRFILDITGTGVAETTVTVATTNSAGKRAAINSVIGDAVESLWGESISHTDGSAAPQGLLQRGALLGTSIAAFSLANYASADTKISAAQTYPLLNKIARTYGKVQPVALNNLNPTFGLRVSGTVNIRLILWKPIVRKTELTAYALPKHMGSDGIMGADARVGFRNGAALSNGVAIALQSGAWSGGGLTFGAQRIYDGGAAVVGAGSLQATIGTGVWSWTAAITSGHTYNDEGDVTNSFGSVTARNAAGLVAP